MKNLFFFPLSVLSVITIPLDTGSDTGKTEKPNDGIYPVTANQPSPVPKFNAVLFEEAINKKVKNLFKGYAFAIGDKDDIKASCAGGWAQDPADGNLRMSSKIPSCIGSVTKMMSATALLNLLEAIPGVKLDDPVFTKLPKKWQQKYKGTQVECLSYRQLLQHRSGFRKGTDTDNLDSMATLPENCPYSASRSYNNSNISLLRYLVTCLAYPQEVAGIEKKLEGLSFADYSTKANIGYSFPYERYVKKNILDKGLVPVAATCRPEPDLMPKVAKGYSDRNDKKGKLNHTAAEHEADGNHCAPQGSWYMSAEMLVHFGRTMLYSNNYLTNTTKSMLFDQDATNERLGWASFATHDAFGKETGQSKWPWHDGAEAGYFALLMQLPNGFVGSVVVNSSKNLDAETGATGTVPFLADVLINAFYDASHSGPLAEIAKHGIPENSYQQEFNEIWNSGYYPVWVDAYDVAGKTYFNTVFRPNTQNYAVAVKHDMTKESYQTEYDDWVKKKGYRLQQLDNYLDAGKLKFAAIFIKKPGQAIAQPAYHAQTPEQHQTLLEKYTKEGYVPVNVSVVSIGGKRYYSAFYEKRNVGGSLLKSFLSQQEYQDKYDEMKAKNWEQVYINAYHHEGQTRFSVIWYERSGYQSRAATRKSDSDSYQEKWESNTGNGLLTRCVTGYDEGGRHWFAAHWAK
ncbi:MAG TPA: serine hydrolase [Chitinophagaceae bacterium]|jgi:CubicO group peptidase (beta-lactamase class C family)|nr:serine hydrolase [Chitinophagaceae bacterium]